MSLSVANVSAMRALQTSSFVDSTVVNTVYVASQDDFYRYVSGSTLTATDGLVYTSSDGLGQWTRMLIPSRKWTTQTTWSIDESNSTSRASDENTGADDAHPLLTIDEFVRRMRGGLTASTTVRWLSDTTRSTANLAGIIAPHLPIGGTAPSLFFVGVPTVVRSGTLTGATDTPWSVSDSSLATSWSAAGCLSTSSGTRLIRKTDGTKHAFMGYEDVAKTAKVSPTTGYSAAASTTTGTAAASFTNGDAYEVLSLPKFPRVSCPQLAPGFNGAYFIYLDLGGFTGGRAQTRLSGFRAFSVISEDNVSGGIAVFGSIWAGGGSVTSPSGATGWDRSMILGSSLQVGAFSGDLNTFVNVVAKAGQLRMSHTAHGRLGTIYAYDCSGTAILFDNLANCTVDAIHGSGNAGLIVDIHDSGCSINSASLATAFDATTGAAKPISVCGTTYDWVNIPIVDTNRMAGFVVN